MCRRPGQTVLRAVYNRVSPMKARFTLLPARVIVGALVLLAAAGCKRVALTAPTDSTISITSDRSVLPLNGQATLRAVVIESGGTPVHDGTTVTFTSTLGTIAPGEATTVNGIATATFN